jgi:large subunit ribosomal protein L21
MGLIPDTRLTYPTDPPISPQPGGKPRAGFIFNDAPRARCLRLIGKSLSKNSRNRGPKDAKDMKEDAMFAVIKTGGKQYKVASGDMLRVERIAANAGETVQFNEVLMLGGDSVQVGAPLIEDAGVQAEVVDQIKGEKVINFVKRRRKHSSKRTKGHRQNLTIVKIGEIMASGAGKSGGAAAIGTGSVSAAAVAAITGKAVEAKPSKPTRAEKVAAPKAEAPAAEEKKAAPKAKKAAASDGDDLTTISGVGPVIVKKLHGEGVTTFAQIAAWTDADVEAIEEKLSFKGRVGREEWIKQAKELAKG